MYVPSILDNFVQLLDQINLLNVKHVKFASIIAQFTQLIETKVLIWPRRLKHIEHRIVYKKCDII